MSEFKVDLTKLKQEIDSRKGEMQSKDIAMGRETGRKPKKAFLNELVTSMHHGTNSTALEAIRAVNETVENRHGAPVAVAKNQQQVQRPQPRQHYVPMNENVAPPQRSGAEDWGVPGITTGRGGYPNMGGGYPMGGGGYGERDDLFEQNIQAKMAEFDRMKMSGHPIAAKAMQNYQGQQYNQQEQQEQIIVETSINEQVERMVNERMERSLERMVENTFKNVLTNIYTKQKIQESMADFLKSDDFVKVVGQAINEIAKRNKAKQVK